MAKKPKKPKKKAGLFSDLLVIIVFFVGLSVFAYPFVANAVNNLVMDYRLSCDAETAKENAKKQLAEQKEQNALLAKNGLRPNADIFKKTGKVSGSEAYRQKHLIGAVTIPQIRVNIPLYDTTNDTLLESGAVVLPGTSFPTGGKDTHTVISAHSGLPSKKLFTDLEDVKKGQTFIITVDDKHMAYKVNKIEVIKPDQTDKMQIEAGKDLATLMTCTPYMINSHRLLVTGYRVPYTEAMAKKAGTSDEHRKWQSWAWLAGALLAVAIAIWLIVRAVKKHRKKLPAEKISE